MSTFYSSKVIVKCKFIEVLLSQFQHSSLLALRHDIQHNDTQHYDTQHYDTQHIELTLDTQHKCHSAKQHSSSSAIMLARDLFNVILNVVMLNVVMLNVVMLNVGMLNVVMLNVVMLNVVMLNVVILNVVMLNVLC
jgi:hypothetical protein